MSNPLIVALDVSTPEQARELVDDIGDAAGAFKVGLELYLAHGRAAIEAVQGLALMLDLKLHDIPTTVARAISNLPRAKLITLHALGGRAMLEAANEVKEDRKTIAVTILTSLGDEQLKEIGLGPAREAVPLLATVARETGCDGVVCAPTDVEAVRAICPRPFLIVTPGVRPAGSAIDDQARAASPAEALAAGADRIVIGRPITRAPDPRAAAQAIIRDLS
jgi:orotidine-5'-phosphate decarboxylase